MKHLGKNLVIVLALGSAGFFAAWLRVRSQLAGEGDLSDGAERFASLEADPIRYAIWDEPGVVPGEVNTGAHESRPALSPDGRWLVFAVGERGLNSDLYLAEIAGTRVLDPQPISALASAADELAPAFAEGALWFASDRPGGAGGLDLYRAEFTDGICGPPQPLPRLNGAADDSDPAPRADESALVFASNRGGSRFDLFLAEAPLAAVGISALTALNSEADEREPAFGAGEQMLFFATDRSGTRGGFDLYQSRWHEDHWLEPRPLATLNGPDDERGPAPSGDGFALYFERSRGAREGDLYRARSLELYRLPGLPVGWMDYLILGALLTLALLAWLAQRWPAIDILYKCFLVSLIVHLLLLWWFHSVYMEQGAGRAGTKPDVHRVRLLRETLASDRERGGHLETARGEARAELERAQVAELTSDESRPAAEALALEAPTFAELEAPERTAPSVAPIEAGIAGTAAEVAVASPAEPIERRAGGAPALALGEAQPAAARTAGELETPSRIAAAGVRESEAAVDAPTTGAPWAQPSRAADASAPARRSVALTAPAAADTRGEIALAQPVEPRTARGGEAPALAIELSKAASGATERSTTPGSPQRARTDERIATDPVAPAGPILATKGSLPIEPASRSAVEFGPDAGRPERMPSVALADAQPPAPRIGGERSQASRESDLLSGLLPAAAPGAQESDSAAPERWRPSGERAADPTPVPAPAPALAASAPPEREPTPRERKSWEHTPYQNRAGEEKARAIELHGGSAQTEEAVAKGLAYLARIQRPGGHWGRLDARDEKYGAVAIGKSGLCLLAFLGAGHTQSSKTAYSDNAARALAFLLGVQDEESGHFGDSEAYSHGIATFAIAECFALTGDPTLRAPLERAVAHILAAQSKQRDPRLFGGWSYYYADERTYDRWPRTSITAWQVMALESARLSGLGVPDHAFADARAFLLAALDEDEGYIRYNHDPERLESAYPTLPASTPAGLFSLSLLGVDVGGAEYAALRAFVSNRAPSGYRKASDEDFVHRASGNLYFWYYGTLAMFRVGGPGWESWNEALKATLLPAQHADGSWKPIDVYSRYARDGEDDKSYSTALCVLSLEIYYRYFLPLLKVH